MEAGPRLAGLHDCDNKVAENKCKLELTISLQRQIVLGTLNISYSYSERRHRAVIVAHWGNCMSEMIKEGLV